MPVSLLNTDTSFPTFTEETPLKERVDKMTDYLYMLLEELRYTFGNLGEENFNDSGLDAIGKTITKPIHVKIAMTDKSVAELKVSADANGASIEEILKWEQSADEQLKSVSEAVVDVEKKADANGASISQLVQWKGATEEEMEGLTSAVATIDSLANDHEASISQIVSAVGNGGKVTAASIVTAVNEAGSSVKISADHVDITGLVTFEDLEEDGKVIVNGNNVALTAYPEGDSISELSYWKYRYTDYDPDNETPDELMFRIRTIDNDREGKNSARFAAVIQTFDRVYENNTPYAVALKLISGGDMSLESDGLIYMYAAEAAQIAAYGNVRIEAVRTYASANNYVAINETDYVFCTDGIYYGDRKILSV